MNLDDAYANAAYIPEGDHYPARWSAAAAAFRAGANAELDVPYGPSARQTYDLFFPEGEPVGHVIFVHGGYWRAFDTSFWSHLAQGPLARGYAVAMPSYDLCPEVGIPEITKQIARAVGEIVGGTVGPIYLAGHSAGGQLVARMLDPKLGLPWQGRIRRVMPISPVADLAPLALTSMNADLRIDAAVAAAESPVHQPAPDQPVTVWVGAEERPAFLTQAQALAQAWRCDLIVDPARHHFDVIDGLMQPDSAMTEALLR